MSVAIQVENLSKIYRLGEIGTGTISRDLERFLKVNILGKEDPFLKIGEANDRSVLGVSDIVYSLRDINFLIEQGDTVGIIGKNGAGKSTLLKLLSRVTSPTSGKIHIRGRVASLLEVGTGFHPELTGRENIFLNGAILGMRKKEIQRKLDEIIDFSGVQRYVDTPVKRYSSGMYVRLAFAVAAHLESEILIVDEVLAVGDAEFQRKCLGKMSEVSKGEGRTVIFVSHNMASIKTLCKNALLLQSGQLLGHGEVGEVVDQYLNMDEKPHQLDEVDDSLRSYSNGEAYFRTLSIHSEAGDILNAIPFKSPINIHIGVELKTRLEDLILDVKILSREGIEITHSQSNMDNLPELQLDPGNYEFKLEIENRFQPGNYFLSVGLHHQTDGATIDYLETAIGFEILNISYSGNGDYTQKWKYGYLRPVANWQLTK